MQPQAGLFYIKQMTYKNTADFAKELDANDEIKQYRNEFHIPLQNNGEDRFR